MSLRTISFTLLVLIFTFGCTETSYDQKKPKTSKEVESTIHTSQNSLDWSGTYTGTLPCASCEGIKTALTLNEDGTYTLQLEYLGEDEPNSFETKGSFCWNEAGNTITLENEEIPNRYFVGENYVAKLDSNGERITGELSDLYTLRKK